MKMHFFRLYLLDTIQSPLIVSVFSCKGVEIDDCMMVVDDDRMFLSQGEPFASRKPYRESNENKESANSQQVEAVITEVGPYTIGEYLGRGGFGEVRVGINQLSGEKVALKFLRKCDICTVKAAERTGTEIQCLSSLNHPNIIRLFVVCSTLHHLVFINIDAQCAYMILTI